MIKAKHVQRQNLLPHAPGGALSPAVQGFGGPCSGSICVADVTGVRNSHPLAHGWANESEGVTTDIHIRDRLLDFWHVACDAFITRSACLVMRVLLESRGAGAVGRTCAMAVEAKSIRGFD